MSATLKALRIIRDNDIRSPREFAKLMWPDSEGWKRVHKVGRGSSRGAMMAMAGGGFLGRLRQAGLINMYYGPRLFYRLSVTLTAEGREKLEEGNGSDG